MSPQRNRTSRLFDALTRMLTAQIDAVDSGAPATEELWALAWAVGVISLTISLLDVDSTVAANANAAVLRAKGLSHRLRAVRGGA